MRRALGIALQLLTLAVLLLVSDASRGDPPAVKAPATRVARAPRAELAPTEIAGKPQFSIVFDVDPTDEPAYLCVITALSPPTEVGVVRVDEVIKQGNSIRVSDVPSSATEKNDALKTAVFDAKERRQEATTTTCASRSPACLPELGVLDNEKSNFIVCTKNEAQSTTGERRLAVVHVGFDRNPNKEQSPAIKSVSLRANIVTLALFDAENGKQHITAVARDGDYADAGGGINVNGRVALRLVPRCRSHDVELPPMEAPGATRTATLTIGDEPPRDCTIEDLAARRFTMPLPNTKPGIPKTLTVAVTPRNADRPDTVVRTRWTELEPPPTPRLRASTVSFTWRRDCLYPGEPGGEMCPPARILGVGLACEAREKNDPLPPADDICHYRCEAEDSVGSDFDLPTRIRFSHGADESWEQELTYSNEDLRGYIPLVDRRVEVDLQRWKRVERAWGTRGSLTDLTRRNAAEIHYILLQDAVGGTHRIAPADNQRVAIQGAHCHEVLSYELDGDRDYQPQYVEIDGGTLVLKSPVEHEKWLTVGFALGSGIAITPSGASALHKWTLIRPYGLARFELDFRPPGWMLTLSPRFTWMLGVKDYSAVPRPSTGVVDSDKVVFNRFAVEQSHALHASRNFTLGFTYGIVAEAPLSPSNFRRVGGVYPAWTMSLFFRPFLARWYAVEVTPRWIHDRNVSQTTDYRGDATAVARPTDVFAGDVSVRFGR